MQPRPFIIYQILYGVILEPIIGQGISIWLHSYEIVGINLCRISRAFLSLQAADCRGKIEILVQ
jgi:hypothetical protein